MSNLFECKYPKKGRIIRLSVNGLTFSGYNLFVLGPFDVFGQIRWNFDNTNNNNIKSDTLLLSVFSVFLLIGF